MNYIEFRNKMFDLACFNINQVYAWQPDFDRNNLSRWTKKGLLIRLRQGYFSFPEYIDKPDYAFYFANRIYRPSYISLHTALTFYGIIPEAVVQITSVSSLKTAFFANAFAEYSYKAIKPELMFGYDMKPLANGRMMQIANREKALIDLLYLYPAYNSLQELENLRLDESFLHEDLHKERMQNYTLRFKNITLEQRVKKLFVTYGL